MMPHDDEDPGLALRRLTLSDPDVRTHMLRHVAAVRLLLTGHLEDAPETHVVVACGFGINEAALKRFSALTLADGNDRLWIDFDVDDALGPPTGLGLFHRDGARGTVTFLDRCRLCAPIDGGPTHLVFERDGETGLLAYRRGRLHRRAKAPVPSVARAGFLRAEQRLRRSLASRRLRDLVPEAHVRVFRADG